MENQPKPEQTRMIHVVIMTTCAWVVSLGIDSFGSGRQFILWLVFYFSLRLIYWLIGLPSKEERKEKERKEQEKIIEDIRKRRGE